MERIVARRAALGIAMAIVVMSLPGVFAQEQPIYGSQLMTRQEQAQYRDRLRAAQTAQEREQIRLEHQAQMQERAREMGIELPAQPPAPGMGGQRMGPPQQGTGSGAGMGPGGGGRGRRGG